MPVGVLGSPAARVVGSGADAGDGSAITRTCIGWWWLRSGAGWKPPGCAPSTPELSRAVGVGLNEQLCGLVDERED